ncbi:hypothetical protein LshimejAT787_0305330 [Lyophyllum shimeji]|uniref:Transmembrane protein n=1 Tax=Lyophyllum shimeji TaxID=47721 RepID=A0A9P3PHV4_LYOSH|nr:hypothetical protein LshimejAT787_0305330 [Lyophyllum shimeji]
MDRLHPDDLGRPSGSRHVSARSQDTNASGIADSTISYGESLSQFPQPPASIPTTPIRSEFGVPSPSRSTFSTRTAPLLPPRRKPLPVPGAASGKPAYKFPSASVASGSSASARSGHSEASTSQPSSRQPAPRVSPYDWHDGASSIGMDATEDRLLSTSFITSLLRESSGNRENHRASYGSDGLSGFSEMTYPPLASSYVDPSSSTTRALVQRPQGKRPPPSAFAPIQESPNRLSGDSETIYSVGDHSPVVRKASVSRGTQGASVVGVASATLHITKPKDIPYGDGGSPFYTASQPFLPQDGPAGGVRPRFLKPNSTPQRRESLHSVKSVVPSIISRISSHLSIRRILEWRKAKPLPPVPLIPHVPIAAESEHRREEESKSLPELVNRVGALQGFLEKGYDPHQSVATFYAAQKGEGLASAFDDADTVLRDAVGVKTARLSRSANSPFKVTTASPRLHNVGAVRGGLTVPKRRRTLIVLGVFLAVCLAAVCTAVGITVGRKKSLPVCAGNMTGAACNLNSTCVCTSSLPEQCDGLAQNIVDLIPTLNKVFLANLTSNAVYNKIWLVQGAVPGSCASQSRLVDVAPALTSQLSENITQWAQTALLWNLVESQDLKATAMLQKFIQSAPWKTFDPQGSTSPFSTTVSGYIFNFATQEVTSPNVSFVAVGQPTAAQLSQVGPVAQAALDRMYSFASASSTQHRQALEKYWTTVLQQKLADLPTFISAFSVSPILLPFDAAATQQPQSVNKLLTPSTSSPFPPPLSCYPGLEPDQIQQVNAIEGGVFGLSQLSSAKQFDPACYTDRPIYGVLDVLRLRLPFLDPRSGIPRQAAVLKRDVAPRVIMRTGMVLSPLPGPSNVTVITTEQSDPRQYGTLGQFNHVVLRYLSSIPRLDVANALVNYVLASASAQALPPTNASILYDSLATIPAIEVAVFGSITPSDISSAVSAFTTPSGSLFFGSDQGTALRNWAITGCSSSIAWAEAALSPVIVRDNDFLDSTFNQTWTAVSTALRNGIGNVGLINITDTFAITKKFTPS